MYATAFFDQKELDDYLTQVEEAKQRDHRILGKQLELFTISPIVGSGLILWLPKGALIRGTLEDFVQRRACASAATRPSTRRTSARSSLYKISGHYPYYADSQFPPMDFGGARLRRAKASNTSSSR